MGAHEHGHGNLNIAMEGDIVGLELRVPGADIVGFEHEANSAEDKAALKEATQKLVAPLSLFKPPAAAGCKVTSAKADFVQEEHHEHHEGEKEEDHKEHAEHGEDHDDDHHEEHAKSEEAEAEHAEFHAEYQLTCSAPEKLTTIDFAYFKTFKNTEELEVNIVTAKGQSQYEVTRDKPTLDLGGVI